MVFMNKPFHARLLHPLALSLLLLTGCVDSESVPKVRIESGPPLAWGLEPTAKIKPSNSGVYLVQPGDTLWAIAAVHGVEVEDLAQWNRLQNPDQLWVGQRIVTVKPADGDQPSVASHRLEPPTTSTSDIETKDVPFPTSPRPEPAPRTAVTEYQDETAKPDKEPEKPRPVTAKTADPASGKTRDPERYVALPTDPTPKPKAVPHEVADTPEQPVKSSWQLPAEAPKVWIWPHSGKIIGKFGKQGARQNNGIDIAANEGDAVMAAADGIVAYADDSLPGYGNLILLRHGGNFTTAYAHNQKILVKRGQAVKAGEKIALAGRSGSTKQAQIHFELRHHIKPLNPMQHLVKRN